MKKEWETPVIDICYSDSGDIICISTVRPWEEDIGEWDGLKQINFKGTAALQRLSPSDCCKNL